MLAAIAPSAYITCRQMCVRLLATVSYKGGNCKKMGCKEEKEILVWCANAKARNPPTACAQPTVSHAGGSTKKTEECPQHRDEGIQV